MPNNPNYLFLNAPKTEYAETVELFNAFSEQECSEIIKIGSLIEDQEAVVGHTNTVNQDIRNTSVKWLYFSEETEWIWSRLENLVNEVNNRHFDFDLIGFLSGIQLLTYSEGSYFKWHKDCGFGNSSLRKLSLTVQLSDSDSYEGGDLELFYGYEPVTTIRNLGGVCLFPSYTLHRVTEVTKGIRNSLVVWASGNKHYR